MSPFAIPVRRPVATSMFFLGVLLLGLIAWQRIPVELVPPLEGEELFVNFIRPGSEPEVVEREMLLPLTARAATLPDIEETWGEIKDSSGTLRLRFRSGADLKVRELELRRIAAEMARTQPVGAIIDVSSQDLTSFSRFVMYVQVVGMDDRNSLMHFVDERITPRLSSVEGVSQVQAGGGAPQELTVDIDPDRCAALGIQPTEVAAALARSVQRLRFMGGAESEAGRSSVVLDGRPRGPVSLAEMRIRPESPVLLRHVADVSLGTGRETIRFRVNAQSTVALVIFQEEGANLVRLGKALRTRLDALKQEYEPFGIDFLINFDAAEVVGEQLDRLKALALSGFVISLLVLFLFLRQWRAVAVVAVAVPTSLLAALALLYLAGQSINLLTLFGLAVGIGMLVDNSIVVYEAVQRQLEHGADPDHASEEGVRRTVRAILAATATNAVVFLPVGFANIEQAFTRSLLEVMAIAILLPMAGSLLVAVGLVPLLARRLAAPAALKRMREVRERRESLGGMVRPDRGRELFVGVLIVALRRPGVWITGVLAAVLLTVVVALPLVAVGSANQEPPEENPVRISVEITSGGSMEHALGVFERLERATMAIEGVERVESVVQEDSGSLTVHLPDRDERAEDLNATRVRAVARQAAAELQGVEIVATQSGLGGGGGGSGGGGGGALGGLLGQGPASVVLSGPDARSLNALADELEQQLQAIDQIEQANVESDPGQEELRVIPNERALAAYGLTADQVLPALGVMRREGIQLQVGFTMPDGREVPLTVRREVARNQRAQEDLLRLRLSTPAGVLPLEALADVRRMAPPPSIQHHNGRREISVAYTLSPSAPKTGSARIALDGQIQEAVQQIYRPPGYSVEAPGSEAGYSWFREILLPILLLLLAVLAVTFESLTLPLLVLVSLPLTVLGATWALVITGTPGMDPMVLMGVVALIGLTVNPAILLVDRMQQRARVGNMSAGAAALGAVRERARPILMTTATSIAGLWPLALVTGEANEIWPPFATVVMGGLITSTILTLLAVPVGFVFLRRLDDLFGRLGPWVLIGWVGATAAVVTPLFVTGVISSLTWRVMTTLLVASVLLGVAVLAFRRPSLPQPVAGSDGPPAVTVKHLAKVYGKPGPIGRAWNSPQRFARQALARSGTAFDRSHARGRVIPLLLLLAGVLYLAFFVQTVFWQLTYLFAASALAAMTFTEIRRARGRADALGRVDPGGVEGVLATAAPWAALVYIVVALYLIPKAEWVNVADEWKSGTPDIRLWVPIFLGALVLLIQSGRRTAVQLSRGTITDRLDEGRLRRVRTLWRRFSRLVFGLDLPREEVRALSGIHFTAERGMVGILGPNGAGKTTLLRMLAGILDPTVGTIRIGGVPLKKLRRYLARYIGYLPQDFGLPGDLTAREYLDYFALHYEIKPAAVRQERVARLLDEVGLKDRADEKIGGYSGGMRQRVAVARTLLRLPPIIIVDEPTVGLDPRERIRFRNLLSRLAEGRVVLFSTHVVEDVAVACERVIVFARGRMVFDGLPDDLAGAAEGRVWETRLDPGEESGLPAGAMLVDQVPEVSGQLRSRILAATQPHAGATGVTPTLEDGYLWLVGRGTAA